MGLRSNRPQRRIGASRIVAGLCAALALTGPAVAQGTDVLPAGMLITCTLRPVQEISVASVLPGVVAEVFVSPGDRVTKGAPLARLDTTLAEADLRTASQRAAYTQALSAAERRESALLDRLKRLERAFAAKAVSRDQFESARNDYQAAQADTAAERQALALAQAEQARAQAVVAQSTITSPATAVVGSDVIAPSESTTDTPIATLYVTDQLRAEAFVPLPVFNRLDDASQFALVVGGNRAEPIAAQIDYIAPLADLSSNTISVFFQIDGSRAMSGETCGLSIE